ncbi:hypothetical protein TNCV_721881 [Trichonephila clavipes]|nr:hypothetical protein TNCV_721881 [Trichonephila clavipes]
MSKIGKTTDRSPFEKGLIVAINLAGTSILKTAILYGFLRTPAISKVFKNWNQNSQSFSIRRNRSFPKEQLAASLINCMAEQGLECASTDTNRQPRFFPTNSSSNHAQRLGMHSPVPVRKPLISTQKV